VEAERRDIIAEQDLLDARLKKIRCIGPIYLVNNLDEGAAFKKYYASLEKGKLSIYKNEEVYEDYEAPIMEPFDMNEYRLVLDPEEIKATSVNPMYRVFRKRLSGHANLTLRQSMSLTDGYDLSEASQKYVFNLVPKVCNPVACPTLPCPALSCPVLS
jgi:hypothetical protein